MVFAGIPSSFFALFDFNLIYVVGLFDLKMLLILASIPYLILNLKHLGKLAAIPGMKPLLVVNGYIVLVFMFSILRGIPINEIITVMRFSYAYPIVGLAFLLYIYGLGLNRIFRLFFWLFIANVIQASLYIISNLFGVEIFQARAKDPLEFEGKILYQNTFAIPLFNMAVFAIAYFYSISKGKIIHYLIWTTALSVIILSFVRSSIVIYVIQLLIISTLSLLKIKRVKFSRNITSLFGLLFLSLSLIVIFPSHLDQLIEKATGGSESGDLKELEDTTYGLRTKAIAASFNSLSEKGLLLFGTGYIREENKKGKYSFVLGGDTYVVPILLTEGVVGLILRLTPIILILLINIRELTNKSKRKYHHYSIITISIIIPELINIVQTSIFTHYHIHLLFLATLEIIKMKHKKLDKHKQNLLHEKTINTNQNVQTE